MAFKRYKGVSTREQNHQPALEPQRLKGNNARRGTFLVLV